MSTSSESAQRTETASLVLDAMARISSRGRHWYREAAAAIDPGLAPLGIQVLRMIEHRGTQSAGCLAGLLIVDPSVMSRQLRQLEDLGLVTVEVDPADRRSRLVSLTARGVAGLQAAGPGLREAIFRELDTWPAADVEQFAHLLLRLADAD